MQEKEKFRTRVSDYAALTSALESARRLSSYPLLEGGNFLVGHGITLGNDGNQVDLLMQSLHELDIQSLERMASGGNKVQTGIDANVANLAAVDPVLLLKVGIKTTFDGLQNGLPAVNE